MGVLVSFTINVDFNLQSASEYRFRPTACQWVARRWPEVDLLIRGSMIRVPR